MGGKAPPRLAERKTTRFIRSPQSGDVVLIAKQARPTSRNQVVPPLSSMTGPSRAAEAAGRPSPQRRQARSASPARAGRAARPESDFGKWLPGKCRYRGNLPESLSGDQNRPRNRGQVLSTTPQLAFLDLKKATISWLQAPRNAADLRACARSKRRRFSCRTVLRHDTRGQNLYRASLFISSKAVDRECIGPAFPRLDNSPAPPQRGCGQPFRCVSYPGSS